MKKSVYLLSIIIVLSIAALLIGCGGGGSGGGGDNPDPVPSPDANIISDLLSTMVYIPGGTFQMGSMDDEYGWAQYTTPVHEVTLQGFEVSAYEVTQAQYTAIVGTNPSHFQEANGHPGT